MSFGSATRGAAFIFGGVGISSSTTLLLTASSQQDDALFSGGDELESPKVGWKQVRSPPKKSSSDAFSLAKVLPKGTSRGLASPVQTISRFRREFVSLGNLGHGGYGRVIRAKNLIDDQQYAVKKIKLGSDPAVMAAFACGLAGGVPVSDVDVLVPETAEIAGRRWEQPPSQDGSKLDVLREARTMATICRHRSLVRYYQSWVEIEKNDSDDDGDCSDSCSESECEEEDEPNERAPYRLVLYIQMQLCNAQTLRDWLVQCRRSPEDQTALTEQEVEMRIDLVRQILAGLSHIHRRGYLHLDLSPANVFLKKKQGATGFHVKLGDFGLAASKCEPISASQREGTLLYMSPERFSTFSMPIDEKADVYAAGTILLELFYGFATEMERIQVLTQLRNGKLPDDVFSRIPSPQVLKTIRVMCARLPAERPSADTLLSLPVFSATSSSQNSGPKNQTELALQLRQKEEELRRQQELIERLQQQLGHHASKAHGLT